MKDKMSGGPLGSWAFARAFEALTLIVITLLILKGMGAF